MFFSDVTLSRENLGYSDIIHGKVSSKNSYSFLVKAGKSPDPATGKGKFSKKWTMYKSRMMNKFKKKYYAKTANLLTGILQAHPLKKISGLPLKHILREMAFLSKQCDSSSWRCVRRIEFTADNAKLDQILPHMNRVVGWKFG